MDLIAVKVLALSLLGGVSLLLGFLPLKLCTLVDTSDFDGERNFWKRTITSVLLCYGGGVLLATSFVHMLPEVRESMDSLSYDFDGIPAAEIIFCLGFFLIYFIEEMVHCVCDGRLHSGNGSTVQVHRTFTVHSRSCEAGVTDMQIYGSQESLLKSPSSPVRVKRRRAYSNPSVHRLSLKVTPVQQTDTSNSAQSVPRINHNYNTFNDIGLNTTHISDDGESTGTLIQLSDLDDVFSIDDESTYQSIQGHVSGHSHLLTNKSSLRDFLTVLALSCHAIFEGLAVGLEKDKDAVWTLFAAVATHKYVISFCVGLELLTVRTPIKLFAFYISVFSLVSPLGVAIGISISSAAEAGDNGDYYNLAVAMLQGIAGGTLIYVVVFEVLQREKSKSVSGLAQLASVILGFATLLCIEIFAGDHHHEHHHPQPQELNTVNSTISP